MIAIGLLIDNTNWANFIIQQFIDFLNNETADHINLIYAAIWAAIAIVAGLFFFRMFSYLREFLSGEITNRTILLACEDAISFLENEELDKFPSLTMPEQQNIASYFGCLLTPVSSLGGKRGLFPPISITDQDTTLLLTDREAIKWRKVLQKRNENQGINIRYIGLRLVLLMSSIWMRMKRRWRV